MSEATIGATLERDRLERRALRLEHVQRILRDRIRGYQLFDGEVPGGLDRAMSECEAEMRDVRRRLTRRSHAAPYA